jgi:glycosyltransferase involved in cell wall biosynthesis
VRFILIANGLVNRSGHHYMEARAFKEEAAQHGVECLILAHRDILPELREELHALPLFRYTPYAQPSTKRYRGPWVNFWRLGRSLGKQLLRLPADEITAADLVVCPLTTANELLGMALWLARRPRSQRPRLALNFMIDDISQQLPGSTGTAIRKTSAFFYRGAFSLLRNQLPPNRLLLSAGGTAFAQTMRRILKHPVQLFPLPVQHELPPLPRGPQATDRAPLIVILGHMHLRKGANLVGGIVRDVVQQHATCHFLLQANPRSWEEIWRNEIGPLNTERVLVHRGEMTQEEYQTWLHHADLVLMPYSPAHYTLQTSGVFSEAMALGKPCIVPEGTWLAEMARRNRCGVTIFPCHSVETIATATLGALEELPRLTAAMQAVRSEWRETMGMQAFVKRLLANWCNASAAKSETPHGKPH